VTNHHVVAKATEIKSDSPQTRRQYKRPESGSDPRSDLAGHQIDHQGETPEAKMGDSEDLMIGETVIAIATPLGDPYRDNRRGECSGPVRSRRGSRL